MAIAGDRNPVCCIWLEIGNWTPNPGGPGYVVVIQPGGAVIRASTDAQMTLALERLKQVRRIEGERVLLPLGLFTNYPVHCWRQAPSIGE